MSVIDRLHHDTLALIKTAIEEDIGPGDLTSMSCIEPDKAGGEIVAKADGILSGTAPARMVFELIDSANVVTFHKRDGDRFAAGDVIATIDGFNQTVLASERTALNFLGRLSGVATLTGQFVARIAGTNCRILDTRKTTPGWRLLEKEAVVHGGGCNHRMGLYDMVLIKDNHIACAGSIAEAVGRVREFMTTPDYRLQYEMEAEQVKIEIEVTNAEQLVEAVDARADRIMLDNQSLDTLADLVVLARRLNPSIELEASGNVTLDNVAAIAATGIDFVSVGALTHSAPAVDLSMRFVSQP